MTAEPARLPRDLQQRLDVIRAKPLLRRAPRLAQAIEILVRNAYERLPSQDVLEIMTDDDQLLAAASDRTELARRLEELAALCRGDIPPLPPPGGTSVPFETGAPWRSPAEAEWDASRGYDHRDGAL